MAKQPKFTGDLAEPITGPCSDDQLFEERLDRLPFLLDHYGVSRSDDKAWLKLAFRMACDFVPGFRFRERGPGRTGKWRGDEGEQLIRAVDELRQANGSGVAAAIEWLKQQDPQKYGKCNERRYHEAVEEHTKRRAWREKILRDIAPFWGHPHGDN